MSSIQERNVLHEEDDNEVLLNLSFYGSYDLLNTSSVFFLEKGDKLSHVFRSATLIAVDTTGNECLVALCLFCYVLLVS